MNKKQLVVKVSSLEESLLNFKNTWDRAIKGEKFSAPVEILSFEDIYSLMKVLSPRRLDLLRVLHAFGPASIRKLAKELDRDYRNVYTDVKALSEVGIILKKDEKYYVPWQTIVTKISLCKLAPKHTHTKRTKNSAA